MKTKRESELGDVKLVPFVKVNRDKVVPPLTVLLYSCIIVLLDLQLQTHELDFKKLLKFCLIIDGTYDDSSNTGCSIKVHVLAAL